MIIYPAIDIKGGNCVRLTQGLMEKEKIYYEDPREVAIKWQEQGAKILHIVDLDGAFRGNSENISVVKEIIKIVKIPIQIGGGIRSLEGIEEWINLGVKRVILGTKALEDRAMLERAIENHTDKIVVSIDARDGYVTTEGWVKTSKIMALDFVKELEALGVKTVIYTDITRDGMLLGPNLEAIEDIKHSTRMEVIASGGVASLDDLVKLKEMGVEGVIVGKALYEGKFSLQEVEVVLK